MIVDVDGAIFGRAASFIAKELLKGSKVYVVNVEKLIFSGDKKLFVDRIVQKRKMGHGGSLKGPKYSKRADFLVKRMIRGMLPWDRPKGRAAYKRLRCYVGFPEELKKEKDIKKFKHQKPRKYFVLEEAVKLIQ